MILSIPITLIIIGFVSIINLFGSFIILTIQTILIILHVYFLQKV